MNYTYQKEWSPRLRYGKIGCNVRAGCWIQHTSSIFMFIRVNRLGLSLVLRNQGSLANIRRTLNFPQPVIFTKRYQSSTSSKPIDDSIHAAASKNKYTLDELSETRISVLEDLLKKEIYHGGEVVDDKVIEVCQAIMSFQSSIYDYSKLAPSENEFITRTNDLLKKVLTSENVNFNDDLLKKLFLLQPQFPTLKAITTSFYRQGSNLHIPSDVAMVPFRKMIWDAQFQHALDFVELTNGHKNYIEFKKGKLMSILRYFGGSIVGLIACLHGFISVFFPELIDAGAGGTTFGIYGIYACIVTYFVNCGFLGALAFSSKGLENGNLIFKHSTMPYDWYMKVDQMKMCSKIVEADAEINGIDGFATRDVVKRVQSMGFDVNEPEQEVMLRQYWYSSGEGFIWVEPDIDPAEVEWWKHLDDIGVKKVWDQDFSKIESAEADEDIVADDDDGLEKNDMPDTLTPPEK